MFAGKKSAQIREILISESAWEEMTCLFAPSLIIITAHHSQLFYARRFRNILFGKLKRPHTIWLPESSLPE
ncbi:hypothetical protein FLL34_25700 [Klebsiella pneumoniae]|nr:hypothetical protein DVJ73_06850 [Klebsiella pneumoniae]MBC1203382.1 hypothetical protein [Klebsiella pneumoniae]MBC1208849.1 hypothetical protein [Klebsiella pneumoniae]MBL1508430.1 hypothetical protein [Klebsiella pneumoniae]MBL1806400.1 hypothetical protein [Klebsiella pneumoniae]